MIDIEESSYGILFLCGQCQLFGQVDALASASGNTLSKLDKQDTKKSITFPVHGRTVNQNFSGVIDADFEGTTNFMTHSPNGMSMVNTRQRLTELILLNKVQTTNQVKKM